jgi:hypothetical protein
MCFLKESTMTWSVIVFFDLYIFWSTIVFSDSMKSIVDCIWNHTRIKWNIIIDGSWKHNRRSSMMLNAMNVEASHRRSYNLIYAEKIRLLIKCNIIVDPLRKPGYSTNAPRACVANLLRFIDDGVSHWRHLIVDRFRKRINPNENENPKSKWCPMWSTVPFLIDDATISLTMRKYDRWSWWNIIFDGLRKHNQWLLMLLNVMNDEASHQQCYYCIDAEKNTIGNQMEHHCRCFEKTWGGFLIDDTSISSRMRKHNCSNETSSLMLRENTV